MKQGGGREGNTIVSCHDTECEVEMEMGRGTSALHLNEPNWIIDGFNELIVDFLFALVIFLDSTQARPLKSSKYIFFYQSNKYHVNTIAASQQLLPAGLFKCKAGVPLYGWSSWNLSMEFMEFKCFKPLYLGCMSQDHFRT